MNPISFDLLLKRMKESCNRFHSIKGDEPFFDNYKVKIS